MIYYNAHKGCFYLGNKYGFSIVYGSLYNVVTTYVDTTLAPRWDKTILDV